MTDQAVYRIIDVSFVAFHVLLIGFNLAGWAWRRTRRLHCIAITATLLSWFGLGMVYGWGYCPLTDWHWDVKRALGETGLPASWVKYYLDRLTGADWDSGVVEVLVIGSGIGAFAVSLALNLRDSLRRRATDRSRSTRFNWLYRIVHQLRKIRVRR